MKLIYNINSPFRITLQPEDDEEALYLGKLYLTWEDDSKNIDMFSIGPAGTEFAEMLAIGIDAEV